MTGDGNARGVDRPVAVRAAGWGWRHAGRIGWALDGLDLEIGAGEQVLLLGASGSGKSTLLAALAGVLGDDEGEERGALTLDGVHPRAARGRAGLVLQDPETQVILPRLEDDVAFGAENLGLPAALIRARVGEALDAVGLRLPPSTLTNRLSGGQKQRLALAGVLAMGPGLLLLDEPTANLDPEGAVEVRDAVVAAARARGATLVVVEHRVATWADAVDRVVVLGTGGAVIADGPPAAVLQAQGASLAKRGIWVPGFEPAPAPPPTPGVTELETRDLVVGRGGRAVREVPDTAVRAGELLAVGGPNGVGKTTLALTLGGLLPPVAGAVVASARLADGARGGPIGWRSRQLLTRIAVVLQSPQHQFLTARVRDEIGLALRTLRRPEAERAARTDELLERMGLTALADANPFTLSGGQQRRLSVAGALAAAPRVVVLDEPTFGQDAVTWAGLVGLLDETVRAGSAVVAVTHDQLLAAAAGRTLRLDAAPVPAS